MWRNTNASYGLIHIAFHWITAIAVLALFGLGLYMMGLGYYDPWYHRGPAVHKSIGLLLSFLVAMRLIWRLINPKPVPLGSHRGERLAAQIVHAALYLVLILVMTAGYLIASADGRAVPVFDWFSVPAVRFLDRQADLAGDVHEISAWLLMALIALHALAALKHHYIDRDASLKRMLWPRSR